MGVTKYDPRKVSISWNKAPLNGFATGTFIAISRRSPLATLGETGNDGESAQNLSGDHSYTIQLTVKKGSPANTVLSAAARSAQLGTPVSGEFVVRDPSVGAVFIGQDVFITDPPDFERDRELGEHTWGLAAPSGTLDQPGRI